MPDFQKWFDTLAEKFQHPLLGPFASSWILINWEIFYSLTCGVKDFEKTIILINNTYLTHERICFLVWYPLLSMLVYVVLGPVLRNIFLSWLVAVDIARQSIDMKIRKLEPVPNYEFKRIQEDLFKQIERTNVELGKAKEETAVYRESFNLLNSKNVSVPTLSGNGSEGISADTVIKEHFKNRQIINALEIQILTLKGNILLANQEIEELRKTQVKPLQPEIKIL